MANKRRDPDKERFWRDVLARQSASELSVRAFCRREMLREPLWHAWRRTIGERDAEARPQRQPAAFVPLQVIEPARREHGIEIALAGGRTLRLPTTIAVEWLAGVRSANRRGGFFEGRGARSGG